MRVPRIYTPSALRANSQLQLDGQAGHYLNRVLRAGPGDPVRLFNGSGGEFVARIASANRGTVELEVLRHEPVDRESALKCHLGLVASKGDRMDWAIQKCTELGISSVTPLLSERCPLRTSANRMDKKVDHWRQVAISACEQSGRNRIPTIGGIMPLQNWLLNATADLSLVFTPDGGVEHLISSVQARSVNLLVGPEGGLSPAEITLAAQHGFQRTRLGPRILRTETAPVTALSLVQFLWGDLGGCGLGDHFGTLNE